MLLSIFGRQPALGRAELERIYGSKHLTPIANQAALLDRSFQDISPDMLGGTVKIAEVVTHFPIAPWKEMARHIVQHLQTTLPETGKVTLGFSVYGSSPSIRDIQKLGLVLKQKRPSTHGSLRLIPQTTTSLNAAQVRHNKLGTSPAKQEIIIVIGHDNICYIGTTRYVQNIDAYAFRDRSRPRRDTFVGMLPPKLAQIMINLAGTTAPASVRLLDPFCGTGVILQEAALMHYHVYGTDNSEKMIRYSHDNLTWLHDTHRLQFQWHLHAGDATTTTWQQPIDLVVTETYLGPPFRSEPSVAQLENAVQTCNTITQDFLKNLAPQIAANTSLCLAVPAWYTKSGVHHLPILDSLAEIGYNRKEFTHATHEELIYHREDQVVGRELLVLTRST